MQVIKSVSDSDFSGADGVRNCGENGQVQTDTVLEHSIPVEAEQNLKGDLIGLMNALEPKVVINVAVPFDLFTSEPN